MKKKNPSTGLKTLLVGVSNPATANRLVALSAVLAERAAWDIVLVHVVRIASQISLTTGQGSAEVVRARDFLQQVRADAADAGVKARALVEVAREVDEGLLSAAETHGAEMILVGYSEESAGPQDKHDEEAFDRTMHRVARKAKADVVVAKFRGEGMQRIMVPVAAEPPFLVTGELCRALGGVDGTTLTFLHVVEPEADLDGAKGRSSEWLAAKGVASLGHLVVKASTNPVDTVVEEAELYDLVIVGPSGRPGFLDTIFSSRGQKIADEVPSSVLMAWNRRH
jgi:nucleotide-binding universal stress UspA family protein